MNVISINIGMFILAIGFLAVYFLGNKFIYLVGGLVLLGISLINLLNEYAFPNVNIKGFLFLAILAILGFMLFIKQKNRIFFMLSMLLGSFSIYSLIRELVFGNVVWTLFILFSLSFYIYYLVGYRELDIEWPRNISIGLLVVSLVLFIASKTTAKITFWKFLNYLWPVLLIIVGGRIIYKIYKTR